MQRYQHVFQEVERNTSMLLAQIGQHLRDYTQTTSQGYERLITVADEHFKNATERLGSSVGELDEYLQELTAVLAKAPFNGGTNGGRR